MSTSPASGEQRRRGKVEMLKNHNAALAAASFVVVTQICTRDAIDLPLKVATWVFAATIPFLVGNWILLPHPFDEVGNTSDKGARNALLMHLVHAINLCGFVAFFWHFGMGPMILFCAATAFEFWRVVIGSVLVAREWSRKSSPANTQQKP